MKPFRKVTAVFDLQAVHPSLPTQAATSRESVPILLDAVAPSTSAQNRLPQPHRKHTKYDLCIIQRLLQLLTQEKCGRLLKP